jgi:hypothetical protein
MGLNIKQLIRQFPMFYPIRNWIAKKRQRKEISEWERKGKPVPPPHIVKQRTIRHYAEKYKLEILVETGTYYGDMVEAMKKYFDHIYTIELSSELYKVAKKRFQKEKHVEVIHGDSGKVLKNLMKRISKPALFWLDGHYSAGVTARGEKDTPIYEELQHILSKRDIGHVIIIDDARCFGTDAGYPTLEELKEFIKARRQEVLISIQDDNIRITPKL